MKKFIQSSIALSALLVFQGAFAAPVNCVGKVNAFLVYSDGSVNINTSYRGDYAYACSLSADRQGVSPQTCALWAAAL